MHYFRRKKSLSRFIWVIALAVVLRSFIAPGYMLSASATDGLSIIFCNGPVSLDVNSDDHAAHHHDGNSDEIQQQVHISPTCGHWSTSSMLVFNTFQAQLLDGAITGIYEYTYKPLLLKRNSVNTRVIRGPPLLV